MQEGSAGSAKGWEVGRKREAIVFPLLVVHSAAAAVEAFGSCADGRYCEGSDCCGGGESERGRNEGHYLTG